MSEAARMRRTENRYEPSMGSPVQNDGASDPLAELARLVGQDDPFRKVFRPVPVRDAAVPPNAWAGHERAETPADHWDEPAHDAHDPAGDERYSDDHHGHAAEHHDAYDRDLEDHYAIDELTAHPDQAGLADEHLQPSHPSAAAVADLWADGEDGPIAPEVEHGYAPAPTVDRASARRPLFVLAAVLLLTVGGLGATFLAKGKSGAAVAGASQGAPTIMAATGPTKVKLADTSTTAPEDQDAALLNKNAAPASGPVKVVTSQEQPIDLNQLPKTSDLADGARPTPTPPSPFPEPKKVKTFLVHANGAMLGGSDASADASAGANPPAAATADTAVAATPKTATTGNTTPKTIASLAADPAVPSDDAASATKSPRQPASPTARATPKPKPVETADAGPAAAAGGAFGVQLAASPSEAEAHAAFAKMKKKFPDQLGAYTASVQKSDKNDKTVYRVRIGGMAKSDADGLCSKLQAGGGTCFVVHNGG